jgi:hypothetical protein
MMLKGDEISCFKSQNLMQAKHTAIGPNIEQRHDLAAYHILLIYYLS